MLAVMSCAFSNGRREAIGVSAGIAAGAFMWAMASAFGITAVSNQFPWVVPLTGLFGGSYLLRLGFLKFHTMRKGSYGPTSLQTGNINLLQGMCQGFLVIASNPKVAMFWISISAFIVNSNFTSHLIVFFAGVCSLLAFTIYGVAAIILSDADMRAAYFRSQKLIDFCFASIFSVIGFYLIWYSIELLL